MVKQGQHSRGGKAGVIHRTVKGVFQGFGAFALITLLALPMFVWRLSEGPISVAFLTPYVEEALSAPDKSYSVQLDDTVLGLDENRMLDIRAQGVRLLGAAGQTLASIPEIGITLSPRSMARGVLGLRRITISRPMLRLTRGVDGKLDLSFGESVQIPVEPEAPLAADESQKDLIDTLLEELTTPPDPGRTFGMLTSLLIHEADLTLVDKMNDTVWHAPNVELLVRRDGQGLSGKGEAELEFEAGTAKLDLGLRFDSVARQLEVDTGFLKLAPSHLARLMPEMQPLTAIDLPLSGQVKTRFDVGSGKLGRIDFDMAGGEGKFVLPKPLSGDFPVQSLLLKGSVSDEGRRFAINDLTLNLGGPSATLGIVADGLGTQEMSIQGEAVARDMPMDRLHEFWPPGLAKDARDWIMPNLSRGLAKEVSVRFGLKSDGEGGFKLSSFSGGGDVVGMTVNYLDPMPKGENVDAYMSFTPNSYHLDLKAGQVFGLKLKSGRLDFTGLDQEDQFMDVKLDIDGPLSDALKLIDSKPLEFARALGIDPKQANGDASAKFHTYIPLAKSLRLEQVQVDASARIDNLVMPKMLAGLDITGGGADLKVDTKGLDLVGKVKLANMLADLEWRENFTKQAPFRSRYHLKGNLDEPGRAAMGLDMPPFTQEWIEGPVGVDAVATLQQGGKGDAQFKLDLTPAKLKLVPAGYTKAAGEKVLGEVQLSFGRKGLAAVNGIRLSGDKVAFAGSVQFAQEGGALRRVGIDRLRAGRTDATGSLAFEPGGRVVADIRGDSLDASLLLEDDGQPPDRKAPPMVVQANLKRLWINKDGGLDNAQIVMSRSDGLWRNLTAEGLAGGKPLRLSITPEGQVRRRLFVVSQDAGATISGLGILDNVKGGKLEISGVYDDSKPETPLEGTAKMQDFYVVRAPVLARILTVAGITGIVDALKGDGIGFSRLEAPFILSRGKLYLRDAQASGSSIGVTAKGNVDMTKDIFDLEGTLVPAYALNSLLGNIPVLGNVFSGGDKGGGVFAFNYSLRGPADDPSVGVNPLSALTPGFLRNLFGIFDKGPSQAPPPAEGKKP
jgi:hypothetical protein